MFQCKQEEDKLINDSVHVYWKAIAIRSSNESLTPLASEKRWGKNTANAASCYQSVVKSKSFSRTPAFLENAHGNLKYEDILTSES